MYRKKTTFDGEMIIPTVTTTETRNISDTNTTNTT